MFVSRRRYVLESLHLEAYETGEPPGHSPDAHTFHRQEGRAENGEGVELQIMWSPHR